MNADVFQAIRTDPSAAIELIAQLENVNSRSEFSQSLLHEAVAYDRKSIVRELIRRGADVDAQDERGQTPLHFAVTLNRSELVRTLLEAGASISITDQFGNSPLWTAVFNARGSYEIVELLLRSGSGVMVEHKNTSGRSPLDFARQIGDSELEKLLLQYDV